MFTFLPGPFLVQFSGPFYLSTDSSNKLQDFTSDDLAWLEKRFYA